MPSESSDQEPLLGRYAPSLSKLKSAGLISRAKLWLVLPRLLVAVTVIGKLPWLPTAALPLSTPVAELSVTPLGRAPVSLKVAAGKPAARTLKEPSLPASKVALP